LSAGLFALVLLVEAVRAGRGRATPGSARAGGLE
jgi:hypothetical protein